jgi:uncharacterized RDD family membrane protein YckC
MDAMARVCHILYDPANAACRQEASVPEFDNPFDPPATERWRTHDGGLVEPVRPASPSERFAAHVIDNALVLMVSCGALAPVMLISLANAQTTSDDLPPLAIAIGAGAILALFVLYLSMGVAFESSKWRGTPGKRFLGLEVRQSDGQLATTGQLILRHLAKTLLLNLHGCCTLVFGLTVFVGDQRGLWNLAGGTQVFLVREDAAKPGIVLLMLIGLLILLALLIVVGLVLVTETTPLQQFGT